MVDPCPPSCSLPDEGDCAHNEAIRGSAGQRQGGGEEATRKEDYAVKVMTKGVPEVIQAVEEGHTALSKAAVLSSEPEPVACEQDSAAVKEEQPTPAKEKTPLPPVLAKPLQAPDLDERIPPPKRGWRCLWCLGVAMPAPLSLCLKCQMEYLVGAADMPVRKHHEE
jgi:hypothetical protein